MGTALPDRTCTAIAGASKVSGLQQMKLCVCSVDIPKRKICGHNLDMTAPLGSKALTSIDYIRCTCLQRVGSQGCICTSLSDVFGTILCH